MKGTAIKLEIKDEKKWYCLLEGVIYLFRALFFDKKMGEEVDGGLISPAYAGYIFKISGGQDKQGFAMIQGVFANKRVRLLMKECHKCFKPRRKGFKKKKSVRGCIVGPDIKMLQLVVVEVGEKPIPGLTDTVLPIRLGPKRANRIRKLYMAGKNSDPTKMVIRREITKGNKVYYKAPKIQRLITGARLRRKKVLR